MKRKLHTTVHLLRHFGPGWLMFRAGYELRKRSGSLRRALPATSWDAQPLAEFLSEPRLADPEAYACHRTEYPVSFLFHVNDLEVFRTCFTVWDAWGTHPASRSTNGAASQDEPPLNQCDGPGDSRHRVSEGFTSPVSIADALCDGVFRFFEQREIKLGCPPDWHRHPLTEHRYPANRHWSKIGDFAAGDIKYVWEPSRFAWVYPLVRAYWRTADERYPRLFWELLEDWRGSNPPQQGVHWKCGQEVALRVMACCFGLYGFADSPETTAERIVRLTQLMAVSGQRIENNLSYAVNQQNNHGITEAVGLWTLGLLFPEFSAAARWTRIGRESLEQQCRALIDDDGAFSQHSVNYQRVMLHACLWANRLGELHGQPLSTELRDRVGGAGTFLWHMQDEETGRLPRYGANDGALVLPLTNCKSEDYQPVVQAVEFLRNRKRRFSAGPWDEETLWMFGVAALQAESNTEHRGDWRAPRGGYRVLRAEGGHLFTRAGAYRHRPSHADMLHVDLWWRGQNVAIDPGTYAYNAPPPWDSPFARTVFHNTVTVDGHDQMDRAGRFLWLPWVNARETQSVTSANRFLTCWEGTHDGYQRLPSPVTYGRGILRIGGEHWLIVDSLRGGVPHTYRLHWLLADAPYVLDEQRQHVRLETEAGAYDICTASTADFGSTIVRADPLGPRGWYARTYGDRQPALSWACVAEERAVTFWTLLGPSIDEMRCEADELYAKTDSWTCRVLAGNALGANDSVIRAVTVTGAPTDSLCVNFAANSRSVSKSVSSS